MTFICTQPLYRAGSVDPRHALAPVWVEKAVPGIKLGGIADAEAGAQ
jgi:hypothetical protein